ncbi:MAG: hypothetical protein JW902_00835 [Syntrophaceae bacterium]|nr:hypothetical protein [Syntrophaceae bacterium]
MIPQETAVEQPRLAIPEEFWPLLKLILRNTWQQFLKNLPWTILFAILTYIGYTIFIIFINDGYAKTEARGAALLGLGGGILTGLSGGIIFMLLSSLVAGLVTNAFKKGPGEALVEFFRTPRRVFDYISEAGDLALASFLSGAGISLVIGYVLTGFGNIATAIGVSLLLFSRAGMVLALLVRSAWNSTYGVAQGVRGQAFGIAAGHVALMGAVLGFVVKSVMPGWGVGLGIIFLVAAFILAKGKNKSNPNMTALVLIITAVLWFSHVCPSLAHDGGWVENKRNFWVWVMTLGALISMLTGLGPAAGILFGAAFVQALLGIANSLPPDFDPLELEHEKQGEPSQPNQPQQEPEPQPPLIDPETGQPLIVQDGRYEGGRTGQVWYQGRWMDRSQAAQIIANKEAAYDRDRQKWFDERSAEWEKNVQRSRERDGYTYDAEKDTWVPGSNHPDTIEEQRSQQAQRLNDFIDKHVKDLRRADFLQDLVDRIKQNGGDLDRLQQAIKDNTVGAEQQRNMGDAEANIAEADAWKDSENYASEVQKWSQRANRALGHFAPGSGAIINMLQGGAYGTVQGYDQGGFRGALTASIAQAADAALQKYTGAPGIGSALREQYGSGYEKDKNGNLVSPLERMTNRLWHNFADQYDPSVYRDRIKNAQGIGDLVDVGLDAWDARDDINDLKNRITGADQPDAQTNRETDTDQPGVRRPPDAEGRPRQPDDNQTGIKRPPEEVPSQYRDHARTDEPDSRIRRDTDTDVAGAGRPQDFEGRQRQPDNDQAGIKRPLEETPGYGKDRAGTDEPDSRIRRDTDTDAPGTRRTQDEDGRQSQPDDDQAGIKRPQEEQTGPKPDEAESSGIRKPDDGAGTSKPDGNEGELGGDRDGKRPTRVDGLKLGDQDSDGTYNLDLDNTTKNSLQQYQTQIRGGDDVFRPQGESMDCTVATISKVTGQSYENLDANDNFSKLRSDLKADGDHQGGLQRSRLQDAIKAAGADAEPVVPRGAEGGPKPGSDDFVRNLEDRINRGEKVVVSMNDPDTGGGHAVHIKGVVTEHGITKLQIEDPRRGPLEIPTAVVEKRNLVDWQNSYYVKTPDGDSHTPSSAGAGDTNAPRPTGSPSPKDLGGGYETDSAAQKSAMGSYNREQGLAVETQQVNSLIKDRSWDKVYEAPPGAHGFDGLAKTPDGEYKIIEHKWNKAQENVSDHRQLYDRNGEPLYHDVNGEKVPQTGVVYQGSQDWVWQKIHDMQNSGDPAAQKTAANLSQAMREGKVSLVSMRTTPDGTATLWESKPQPGLTTGTPTLSPDMTWKEHTTLSGDKIKVPYREVDSQASKGQTPYNQEAFFKKD